MQITKTFQNILLYIPFNRKRLWRQTGKHRTKLTPGLLRTRMRDLKSILKKNSECHYNTVYLIERGLETGRRRRSPWEGRKIPQTTKLNTNGDSTERHGPEVISPTESHNSVLCWNYYWKWKRKRFLRILLQAAATTCNGQHTNDYSPNCHHNSNCPWQLVNHLHPMVKGEVVTISQPCTCFSLCLSQGESYDLNVQFPCDTDRSLGRFSSVQVEGGREGVQKTRGWSGQQ